MEAVCGKPHGRLAVGAEDLGLRHTLTPGQSFRWREDDLGRWTGVIGRKVVRLWREGEEILYEVFPGAPMSSSAPDAREDTRAPGEVIADYLRLDVDLQALYADFRAAEEHIRGAIDRLRGLRVLRQDPEETLLSYVFTAANSLRRIIPAIEEVSRRFGEPIAEVDGLMYYSFPTAQALANAHPDDLRCIGGVCFRGPNLHSVARVILHHPPGWAAGLREKSYEEARAELLAIRCIGRKIADCALLFSMDKDQAFPVDTHIRQVAVQYYVPEFKQKTLTPAVYEAIVAFFQSRFGPYAGWAQEYLFYDDLSRS